VFRINTKDLPFVGVSHAFVGADCGDVDISAFLVSAPPGGGPGPHRHPYDEVVFVQSGLARWTINGEEQQAGPGDIVVVKAGEIHGFRNIGAEPLVQLDIHVSPEFHQEDLESHA
jgi:quercetin dioxygenase-like cupin family protein